MFVIAGVSGNVGAFAAQTLLDGGHSVRVIVRDEAKGKRWADAGAEVAVGSLDNVAFLTETLKGSEGTFLLVPPPPYSVPNFRDYQRRMGEALLAAVKTSGVPHVVLLSSVGAEQVSGTGPIAGIHPVEQGLRGLTRATFIRAANFMENASNSLGAARSQGIYPTFTPAAYAFDMVSVADIGAAVARALLDVPSGLRIINLAGPREYSPADVASTLGHVLGREVHAVELPLASAAATLQSWGMPEQFAGIFAEMYEGAMAGRITWDSEGTLVRGNVTLDQALARLVENTVG